MNELIHKPNYDYSETLWMKMFLAKPNFPENRSEVLITFAEALEIIKTIDRLTLGIKKIVYLVGWQGLGHDDCYPEMEVINEYLKRPEDKTAKDSLMWLYNEAKKYNTVVSFHGNVADAYSDTPCFPELAKTNSVVNDVDGKPAVIEIFNGRNAYKTSYKHLWESGLFKKIWNGFLEATPVKEAGTVHLDNFCIAQNLNPYTTVEEEDEGRNKILDYIASTGIDVTSEYTYRELEMRADSPEHPIRKLYAHYMPDLPCGSFEQAPLRLLGRIPATWWTSSMTAEDCMKIPPAVYSGHLTDSRLLAVFYGAMHGEDIWMKHGINTADWADEFLFQFCTLQLPYFYLNRLERLELSEDDKGYTVKFSKGVESRGAEGVITKNGAVLKEGSNVLLPLDEENTVFIAYSKEGKAGEWNIPDADFEKAAVTEITPEGEIPKGEALITEGRVKLDLKPGSAYALRKI